MVTKVEGKRRRLKLNLNRQRLTKGLRIIPNLFTLCNAFFGFSSIILAANNNFVAAAEFILMGAIMDALDGRIARFIKVTSDLGTQLDSLCDAISFCLAPAVLIYLWQLQDIEAAGFLACALFVLAGVLRLARFNVTHEQQVVFSLGTPSTIAGTFLATFLLNHHTHAFTPKSLVGLLILVTALAGLMVSRIPFPTFKQVSRSIYGIAGAIGLAAVVILGFTQVLYLGFVTYFVYALGRPLFFYLFSRFSWPKSLTPKP